MDDKYYLVEEDYDNVEESFHNEYDSIREFSNQVASFIKDLKPGDILLNIGGTFAECRYFIEQGLNVTNLDISQAMNEYVRLHEPRVKVVKANIKDYSESGYQAVWACRSLIHIQPQDIDEVLARIHTNLNSGGILGSIFFISSSNEVVIDEKPEPHTNKPDTTYYCVLYPPDVIKNKIIKAGFTIQNTELCTDQDGDEAIYIEAKK
jgi:cyclopropane fatty-acyl-phospholipid synthase-like methyltransferase